MRRLHENSSQELGRGGSESEVAMDSPPRTSLLSLLAPLLIAFLLVLGVCGPLYLRDANQIEGTTLDNESRRMERFTSLFSNEVGAAVGDLRLLSTGDALQAYLLSGQTTDLSRAERRALFFSKDNPDYDQLRYIDEQGQEVIRLNLGGVIVSRDQLQNKADRYYFQKANVLGANQIYLSTIDLNVEHGAIEQPIKPTLRLAMPVFDANGKRRGIYVINYLVEKSIQRIRQFVPRYAPRFRLLNTQGYWLAAERPEEEWGFMLPDRSGMTLAKADPGLWAKVVRDRSGQVPYQGGYFTWLHALPREFVQDKPVTLVTDDDFLVFASQITSSEWSAQFASLRQTFVVVALVLLILTTVIVAGVQARWQALQERDRFFNLTRDMLCVAGFDGYFKRVNPAWEKALGYTSEEMVAKPFLEFVHPDDREKTKAEAAGLAKGTETVSFENRYLCKDGSYRWLLWTASGMLKEQLIYGSARDLTERRRVEQTLLKSQEMFEGLFECSPDAIILVNRVGCIVRVNAQIEALFGYARDELIGQNLDVLMPERYRVRHGGHLADYFAAPRLRLIDSGLELFGVRKGGIEFPAEIMLSALETDEGIHALAVIRDITSRKQAAEHIQELNEELKQRAELLQTTNKELESFSYSVSHDLRAPLRHIHGFVELLQQSPAIRGDEECLRQMGVISRAAKEMGRLIDDLLAFSRTGRSEMHLVKVDLAEMVAQIIHDRSVEYNGRRVTWDVKPLDNVAGDPGLLRLVWTNLLDNALKYTRRCEETKIEIGQFSRNGGGPSSREVVFYVRDNGVGFDMRYASKLFGVFQRLHRAEDFEGTGIGLANVQRIIHRHGGKVWAESQQHAGATFYFSLPITDIEPTRAHGHD